MIGTARRSTTALRSRWGNPAPARAANRAGHPTRAAEGQEVGPDPDRIRANQHPRPSGKRGGSFHDPAPRGNHPSAGLLRRSHLSQLIAQGPQPGAPPPQTTPQPPPCPASHSLPALLSTPPMRSVRDYT
jgi:hypothetical protein